MSATSIHTIVRTARLALVGAASAVALTGAFAGTASALTPAPQPNLPIAQAPQQPEPPVGPMVLTLPEPDGGGFEGPGVLVNPEGDDGGGGFEGPGVLVNPEDDDDGGGFEGPGVLVNPEGDDGDGGFDGPGDFTNGDPTPDPDPVPEQASPSDATPSDATPSELAFTGSDLGLMTAGLALLGAGGLAAAGGTIARRRQRART